MKNNKIFIFVFIIAFLIRLIALNQSLWLDEATTARVVQQYSYLEIITKFSPNDFHPPLYYLFMKFWTNLFGYSEIALRVPSIFFSLAAGYFVYLIGGVWASIFFLFNPLVVYYSQEARMYMMATMFLTGSLYYFLKILNLKSQISNPNPKSEIFFGMFTGLSFLTFYGSVFLIAAFTIYLLYKKQYKNLLICLFVMLGFFLLVFPLLYKQFINAKISMVMVTNWSLVLGKANLKNLLLIPIKFSIGRIDFYPKWVYYSIAGIWVSFIITQMLNLIFQIQFSNRKTIYLYFYLLIFPIFLGFVTSFFTPLLQYFRFIYLIPVFAILLSNSKLARFKKLILTLGFLTFSLVYLLLPQFHREDWKSLAKSLPKNIPIYMISSSSDPVKYYNYNIKINQLKSLSYESKEGEKVIISYTADIHGVNYKRILEDKKYILSNKKVFRGLELEYWKKSSP